MTAGFQSGEKYGAALLCGGLSRRMGFDKALFLCDKKGDPLLSSLAGSLAEIFGDLVLVTNDRAKLAAVPGLAAYDVAQDLHPGAGPAGAIHTALKARPGRGLFVMACDLPLVDGELIFRLESLLTTPEILAAVPRRAGRPEPLYAFYRAGAEPFFQKALEGGRLAVRAALELFPVAYLELGAEDSAALRNLNTPEEVVRAGLGLPGRKD